MRSLTKAIYLSSHGQQKVRVRLFQTLVAISIISVFVYVYSVMSMARNVAFSQELEGNIDSISSKVEALEFAQIGLKNNVTFERARDLGFKEAVNPLYVSRSSAPSLSFNTTAR